MSDSVGSVSVDVVPDARGWSEKLRAQIRDQSVKVKADADTAEAEAKLDETARTRTAKIKADTSQLSKGASALDSFVGKLGLLPALAITAGAALVPLGAVLGGVVAALAAPLAIAGGGATLFAFLGGAAIKQTQTQLKQVDQLRKNVESARTSLEQAQRSAGKNADKSTAVANAQDRLTKATAAYQQALHGISPQQQAFATALADVKNSFEGIVGGPTGKALLAPFAQGLTLIAYALRASQPIIVATSHAFSDLLTDLQGSISTPGFEAFIHRLARQVGPDIEAFGHIIGDVVQGIGGLFLALDNKHLSGGVLSGLEGLTSNFADWANSRAARHDVRDFFDYFHRVGPQVASTIGAVAHGIGKMVEALAPLGPPVLRIVEGLSNALGSIPTPVLTGLLSATAGIIAFQKLGGFKATSLLTRGLGGGGGVGGLLTGGVQKVFVVNMGVGGGLGGPGGTGGSPVPVVGAGAKGLGSLVADAAGTGGVLSRAGGRLGAGLRRVGLGPELIPIGLGSAPGQQSLFSHLFHGTQANSGIGNADDFLRATGQADAHLKSTTDHFDALRAHAALASRQIDLIGPHTQQTAGVGIHAIDALQQHINSIHDKKFAVIAQTQSAIQSLERLQAMRIADKHFTVYQRNQLIEQAVGPGGGRGRSNPGGSGGGASGGGSRTPVHIHIDDSTTIKGYMDDRAQRTYDSNRQFERDHG